jgi:hypothetical protein
MHGSQNIKFKGLAFILKETNSDRWRALVNTVMNLRVPENAANFLSRLGHVSFSGRNLLHEVSYRVTAKGEEFLSKCFFT